MNKPYSTGCTQVCNQGRDCTCVKQCQSAAPEGGNVWFVGTEPLTPWESITFYLARAVLALISIGILIVTVRFIYQFFN